MTTLKGYTMIELLKNRETEVQAPPAKAYTLRAIIISSLAEGVSTIRNPLLGEDQLNLIECLRGLGVKIEQKKDRLIIHGTNGKLKPVEKVINAGESGVTMNVLSSVASLSDKPVTLTGAEGLLARPIDEVINGLIQLQCDIEYQDKTGFPPILLKSTEIQGGTAEMSGKKTSQYFSSLTLAAPLAKKDVKLICTDIMSEKPYYDITVDMMSAFGVEVTNNDYKEMLIKSGQQYQSRDFTIEGDYSSASFFMLSAAICKSKITISGLNRESKQGDRKFLNYLEKMGCNINWHEKDVAIEGNELRPIKVNMIDTPDLVPPLAIAAAFAEGKSTFTGVGQLRYKECNRLEAVVTELEKMGIRSNYDEDNLYIEGNRKNIHGAEINTYNDHRIAMSFAIAGLAVSNQIITDKKCVAKSFPDFWQRMEVFY